MAASAKKTTRRGRADPRALEPEAAQQSAGKNAFRLFKLPRSPYFHVRMMVGGKRRQFSTGETTERAAKNKARAILADIRSRGLKEAIVLHARRSDAMETNPTIQEFINHFKKTAPTFENPPAAKSIQVYASNLKLIAKFAGAKRLHDLTNESIEKAKRKYLDEATKEKRDPNSARVSLSSMIRNAAALFSAQALRAYRSDGFEISNPFANANLRGVKIKAHSPLPRDVLAKIWNAAPLLRDGDPNADPPDETLSPKRRIDFRLPHPDAFAILYLELGLGLRRNEADKAEWSWCAESADGRRFLEVKASDVFTPKSKVSRFIPISDEVWSALQTIDTANKRFIVPDSEVRRRRGGNSTYRCDAGHRALVEWLHKIGVDSPKPCHALRKEFGSYVATTFSLFHAQKLLGHSTPMITSAYYASLTDLPDLKPSSMGQTKS